MPMKLTMQFTHPPMAVSPNGRVHWGKRAKLVAELRRSAFLHALSARRSVPAGDCFLPVGYALVWYYKGPCPDADNCLARCKALLDGCADAFGVNDRGLEVDGIRRVHTLDERAGTLELVFRDNGFFTNNNN